MKPKVKKLSLTIRRSTASQKETYKIWEWFNPIAIYWFKHRMDGPAVITSMDRVWYNHGQRTKIENP
jgi:hypothetical protein